MSRRPRVVAEPEQGSVAALTHDGAGIVRGGKAAFVGGALPGELIRFRRIRRIGHGSRGKRVDQHVHRPSCPAAPLIRHAIGFAVGMNDFIVAGEVATRVGQSA